MHRILILSTLLVFACSLSACDTATTSSQTDAERIVGSWLAIDASLRTIVLGVTVSVFDALGANDRIAIDFGSDGRFTSTFTVADSTVLGIDVVQVQVVLNDATVSGTYSLDESNNRLTLTPDGLSASGDIEYDFTGENELRLIFEDEELIASLFGVAGVDVQILMNAITGAEITYQRQS